MSKLKFLSSKWSYVFAGIMVGVIFSFGFNLSNKPKTSVTGNSQEYKSPPAAVIDTTDLNVAMQLSNAFSAVARKVNPSVVTIFTESTIKVSDQPFAQSPFGHFFGDDFFNHFFQGQPAPQRDLKQQGLGSGVIVGSDGIILTNNHVVKNADDIRVRLMDGREFKAEVKGTDGQTDLAVITIDASGLTPIEMGDSDRARVGDWVLAIGSPLQQELEHTVTTGIISAKGRSGVGLSQYEDFIQTDAAINPGNSGGAMVNLYGRLIGINAAIATQNGGFMGIGFAIPVNLAKKVMNDILEKVKVVRGWLGVYIQTITPDIAKALNLERAKGVIISKVQEDSPAENAGLKNEDVVLKFNGKEVDNSTELSTWVAGTSPDADITLTILRDGAIKDVKVRLGELTPDKQNLAGEEKSNSFDKVGLTVSNITNNMRRKYNLPDAQSGIVIVSVDPQGLAARNGLKEGDVIVKLNKETLKSTDQFSDILNNAESGNMLLFFIQRGNANLYLAFPMP